MERLKSLRQHEKISREEMASKIGISFSAYRAYEQGKSEPNISTLKFLSDFFDVSIDYLVMNERAKPRQIKEYVSLSEKVEMFVDDLKKDIIREIENDIKENFKNVLENKKED